MPSPVLAIGFFGGTIIHSSGNVVHLVGGDKISHTTRVHGIRTFREYFLVYGASELAIYMYSNDISAATHPFPAEKPKLVEGNRTRTWLLRHVKIDGWISDVSFEEEILVLTLKGDVLDIDGNLIRRSPVQGITSAKFYDRGRECVYGLWNGIFNGNCLKSIHKGRVFDVNAGDDGFVSSGEDRKVCVVDGDGEWEIQEYRNYVWRCGMFGEYVWTLGADGDFKLYWRRKRILTKHFGTKNLSSYFLNNGVLYVGCGDGRVFKLVLEGFVGSQHISSSHVGRLRFERFTSHGVASDLIEFQADGKKFGKHGLKGIREMSLDKYFESPSTDFDVMQNVRKFSINNGLAYTDHQDILFREGKWTKLPFSPSLIYTTKRFTFAVRGSAVARISTEVVLKEIGMPIDRIEGNDEYIGLICRGGVVYLCPNCFSTLKTVYVRNPVCCTRNYIGTRNGWLVYNKAFKISAYEVVDMVERDGMCYFISADSSLHVFGPGEDELDILKTSESECMKCLYNIDSAHDVFTHHIVEKLSIGSRFRYLWRPIGPGKPIKLMDLGSMTLVFGRKSIQTSLDGRVGFVRGNTLFLGRHDGVYEERVFEGRITASTVSKDFLIYGCENGTLVFRCRADLFTIKDRISVEGEISSIKTLENLVYVSTKDSKLYIIEVFLGLAFIHQCLYIPYRAMDVFVRDRIYISSSNGNLYVFDISGKKAIFRCGVDLEKVVLRITGSNKSLYLVDTGGNLLTINEEDINNGLPITKPGNGIEHNRFSEMSRLEKKRYNEQLEDAVLQFRNDNTLKYPIKPLKVAGSWIRIHENSVLSAVVDNNGNVVTSGDDHTIRLTLISDSGFMSIRGDDGVGHMKSINGHSAPVVGICVVNNLIFSLGLDMKLNVHDLKLSFKASFKIKTRAPSSLSVVYDCEYKAFIGGDGFEIMEIFC